MRPDPPRGERTACGPPVRGGPPASAVSRKIVGLVARGAGRDLIRASPLPATAESSEGCRGPRRAGRSQLRPLPVPCASGCARPSQPSGNTTGGLQRPGGSGVRRRPHGRARYDGAAAARPRTLPRVSATGRAGSFSRGRFPHEGPRLGPIATVLTRSRIHRSFTRTPGGGEWPRIRARRYTGDASARQSPRSLRHPLFVKEFAGESAFRKAAGPARLQERRSATSARGVEQR